MVRSIVGALLALALFPLHAAAQVKSLFRIYPVMSALNACITHTPWSYNLFERAARAESLWAWLKTHIHRTKYDSLAPHAKFAGESSHLDPNPPGYAWIFISWVLILVSMQLGSYLFLVLCTLQLRIARTEYTSYPRRLLCYGILWLRQAWGSHTILPSFFNICFSAGTRSSHSCWV